MKKLIPFVALLLTLFSCTKQDILPRHKEEMVYPNVLYLNFDGEEVKQTVWNVKGDMVIDSSGLTQKQQLLIVKAVQQAFDTFKVTVTPFKWVYARANPFARQECIITRSWEWYGKIGGTSYNGSFGWGEDTPAFVFSSLLNYDTKVIGMAVAHELGHTLGLRHHCAYDSSGNRIGEYANEPWIMAKPYKYSSAKWVKAPGSYGVNEVQDDVAIIGNKLGFK